MIIAAALVRLRVMWRIWLAATPVAGAHYFTGVARALAWATDALRRFISEVNGPVNVVRLPQTPSLAELAAVGLALVSRRPFLHLDAMARFEEQLASLQK